MSKNRNRNNVENADIDEMDSVEKETKNEKEGKMSKKKKIGLGIGIGAGILALAAGIFGYETGKKRYADPADANSGDFDDQIYADKIEENEATEEDSAD